MKKIFICEYPYVLYKVLMKASLNKEDIYDIVITNRLEKMVDIIEKIKESKLFRNVYYFDIKKLNLKYYMSLHKRNKNVIKERMYQLKIWKYFYDISCKQKLKDIKIEIDFSQYDEIYCTDGAFVIENYLTVNKIPHFMIEHAKDVYIKANYSALSSLFHYGEIILDKYHITTGIEIASQYCLGMEVNSDRGKDQLPFLKERKLLFWNVEEHLRQLSEKQRETILDIYMKSYVGNFDYDKVYNILLTNPLYIEGDLESEEDQIKVYQEIIKRNHLNHGCKLLIKSHPRDKTDYHGKLEGILIDSMISSEILCISKKLKLNKVVTLYSSSAETFIGNVKEVIKIANDRKEGTLYCKEILKNKNIIKN